ncbi:unnamed protein product, partial [Prorocentrum cordatum]
QQKWGASKQVTDVEKLTKRIEFRIPQMQAASDKEREAWERSSAQAKATEAVDEGCSQAGAKKQRLAEIDGSLECTKDDASEGALAYRAELQKEHAGTLAELGGAQPASAQLNGISEKLGRITARTEKAEAAVAANTKQIDALQAEIEKGDAQLGQHRKDVLEVEQTMREVGSTGAKPPARKREQRAIVRCGGRPRGPGGDRTSCWWRRAGRILAKGAPRQAQRDGGEEGPHRRA